MHDGQNLFDPKWAGYGVDWGMAEAVQRWMQRTAHPGVIVVGIWNQPQRWVEFFPTKPLNLPENLTLREQSIQILGQMPTSDSYLKFLTGELKPFIDNTYRTETDQNHTFIMGSSMGGLISLYALIEYPEIYSGIGCLSTHWPAGKEMLVDWFGDALPSAGCHRLYFDYGTQGLDADYEPFQLRMDSYLIKKGYESGKDYLSLKFPGADHNERAWRERVDIPLEFLLRVLVQSS